MKVAENFYKETATELGIDYDIVRKVNSFYWREGVKHNLSKANYRAIFLKNLGTITISRYKLREEIIDVIEHIRLIRASRKFTRKRQLLIVENMMNNLRKLLIRRNEVAKEMLIRQSK